MHLAPTSPPPSLQTQPDPSSNLIPDPTSDLGCKPKPFPIPSLHHGFLFKPHSFLISSPALQLLPGPRVPPLIQLLPRPAYCLGLHFCSNSLRDRVGPNMSVKYEDLQYLESEKKSQRFTEGKGKGKQSLLSLFLICLEGFLLSSVSCLHLYHVSWWGPPL